MASNASRRALTLLVLGAAAGLGAAATGLVAPHRTDPTPLPTGAVARVNGSIVRTQEYLRAVAALAADQRNTIDAEDKHRVLDRLIEEELLVQRGLELGLARQDRRVRGDLVSAVIAAVVSEVAEHEPTADEIEAFYRQHHDYFTRPGRVRMRQIFVRATGAAPDKRVRAGEAAERLRAGEAFGVVRRELGDHPPAPLPDAPLPPTKLREYLGPTLVRTALSLPVGSVSDPVRSVGGFHVLQILEREPARTPPLEEIEDEVRSEVRRRAGDRALRTYLDDLRSQAALTVAENLP